MVITLITGRLVDIAPKQVESFKVKAGLTPVIMETPGPEDYGTGHAPRPSGDCVIWPGVINMDGYGSFRIRCGGKVVGLIAHRLSYIIHRGRQIPAGLQLDHLCRNRACVNPIHLQAVAPRVNTLRGRGITAEQSTMTHCLRGHELTQDNLRKTASRRVCAQCSRIREQACRDRRKARAVMLPKVYERV